MSKPELFQNDPIAEVIKCCSELSFPHPLPVCCSPSTVGQGNGGRQRFSVCCSPEEPHKTPRGCTQKMSFRQSEVAWQDVRQVDQRLHELCSCKMNMERSCCPPWFFSASTGSPVVHRNIVCLLVFWSYL